MSGTVIDLADSSRARIRDRGAFTGNTGNPAGQSDIGRETLRETHGKPHGKPPRETPRGDAVPLLPAAALDLDQAELFLLSLDAEMLTADGPRTAYLLGMAEGHLANLVELLRAVTR